MVAELQRFGVSIESQLLAEFDRLIGSKGYSNRSEAIRDLIREQLIASQWSKPGGRVVGSITLVYDHHLRELADRLTDLQHAYHDRIISVLHVHLDAHHCLEVMVVKGQALEVKAIADRLGSTKGVKHCQLVSTATGANL